MVTVSDPCGAVEVLAGFDEYLRRVRGVCQGTRRNYLKYAGAFLARCFGDGPVEVSRLGAGDVLGFIGEATARYRPRTVELAATSVRSLLRFLRVCGLRADRLEDAVPVLPHRTGGLVRHLAPGQLEVLIASLCTASLCGLRDRAIILCIARLGMRSSEVVRLRLEDIDWVNATVRLRSRKTGRGALLPLTGEVGSALAGYLRGGRPVSAVREVFVLARQRPGAPLGDSNVVRVVSTALERAGIDDAPVRGANLLRHSMATELLNGGVRLERIADLMGHASWETTRIYAAVDVAALREAALPWPVQVRS